ncbi:MAG: hypothetical protein Q4C67_07915 [Deinococcus sp.]|nr:hypothetical protein [Deinococcus sp.]
MNNPELNDHLHGQTDPQPHTRTQLAESPTPQPEQEQDDAAVSAFAQAMSVKLARAREKGRGGWQDPSVCSVTWLWDQMQEHARKVNLDMVDVANFALMIDWRCAHVPGDRERLAEHVALPQPELSTEQVLNWIDIVLDEYNGPHWCVEDDDLRELLRAASDALTTTQTELERLRAALAEAEARIGRAEALADDWESISAEGICYAAGELRAALATAQGEKGGA